MQKTFALGSKAFFILIFSSVFSLVLIFSSLRMSKVAEIKKLQKSQEKNISVIEESNSKEIEGVF